MNATRIVPKTNNTRLNRIKTANRPGRLWLLSISVARSMDEGGRIR